LWSVWQRLHVVIQLDHLPHGVVSVLLLSATNGQHMVKAKSDEQDLGYVRSSTSRCSPSRLVTSQLNL
jgi:hypothetical protein